MSSFGSEYEGHFDPEPSGVDSDVDFHNKSDEQELKKISAQYIEYLKSIKDNWSSCHAAKLLTFPLIRYMVPRFRQLSAPLRVRMLTSFLYLTEAVRDECRPKLLKILNFAETDANEWVRKMGQLVKPFVVTGMMDLRLIDTETAFRIISFLDDRLGGPSDCIFMRCAVEYPDDGEYLVKPGLDYVHICNPNTFEATLESIDNPSRDDEYTLYTPRLNFDTLGQVIVSRAQSMKNRLKIFER